MNGTPSSSQSTNQYWTCQSSKKDLNGPNTPLVLKLASCLPRRLAIRVEQRIQQAQENQREWVTGVLLCAFAAAIVLFLNVVLTIIAASIAYSKAGDQEFTSATLYRGKCSTSKNWVRGLLFLINVLSTIMLAASNYCMQCLSAPSRKIVDNAHTQQKWLDIGVPSMKNLCFVGWRRYILWILLLISSLPIHLICNSAVFSALGTNEYNVLLELADFDIKNPPDHDSAFASCFEKNVAMNMSDFYTQVAHFEELDKQKCIDTYAVDFVAGRGTLILITNDLTADNESLRLVATGNSRESYTSVPFMWMCDHSN
ncbi:uncharacterized protein ASPGLDRAFT_80648 [Aspergillus glaucus CBS 516.65]|uniref:DUF6536 domain-containing protein n=1 Tax=Aspergillus glaucus CBS 516.65 TaxID=1160497 RepID=A0A1L9VS33_ASPGL|nr:hypothetical protein ASPGLDRAFT_80648 [Aspergillus glaucus CBS 516.65]OJJ86721.1 hypothetical protein ASPGLDRAFT_80648 [Aspergillus glaucus CBS 516.65]